MVVILGTFKEVFVSQERSSGKEVTCIRVNATVLCRHMLNGAKMNLSSPSCSDVPASIMQSKNQILSPHQSHA